MGQALAGDVAGLLGLERPQARSPGPEPVDVVERAADMDRHPLVPPGAIDLGPRGQAHEMTGSSVPLTGAAGAGAVGLAACITGRACGVEATMPLAASLIATEAGASGSDRTRGVPVSAPSRSSSD